MIIRWKIGPKTSSKQRCRIHRKYQEIDAKMELKSIKDPLKNRGPKKDGSKSIKIEAWSAQGSKMSLRLSCGPRDFEPMGPYKPTKRTRIVFGWSHTPVGRWPGEFFPLKPKRITKLFWFLFIAAAIWCNQSRRPAVVYEYIRWQLLQIKSKKAWWLSSVSMGNINILLFFDALRMEVKPSRSQDWQYQKW